MQMLEVTLGYKDAELARQVKQLRMTTETVTNCYVNRQINMSYLSTNIKLL